MSLDRIFNIAGSALNAQTTRMNTTASNLKEVDRNTFWINVPNTYWCMATTGYSNFSGWAGDVKAGPNNRVDNPAWVDVTKNDLRSNCFETQNNVPTVTTNTMDVAKAVSNLLTNDGKAEQYQGWDLVRCAELGNKIGAIKIASRGPQNYTLA